MKQDVKKINRQFLFTLVMFILFIAFIVVIILVVDKYVKNTNYVYAILFALFGIIIYVVSIFKRKFYEITNISYLLKIRNKPGSALKMKHSRNMSSFQNYLKRKGFIKFRATQTHTIYYKTYKDNIKKIFRNYILEVVIILPSDTKDFYIDEVDEDIAKIQQDQINKKQRIEKMLITQIKPVSDMDTKTKEAIKEIVFVKTKVGIVSTVNIGLHYPSNQAILLYSDEYSPSLYYKYHINEIKDII